MTALSIDISNYSTPIDSSFIPALQQAGIQLVIVQSINPPPGYPSGQTIQQLTTCADGGLAIDAYIFFWFDAAISDIQNKLDLIAPFSGRIRQLWLDIEDTAAVKYAQADTEARVQAALDLCDGFQTSLGQPTGIYTGNWFWASPLYMDNTTTWSNRKLWDSNYDGNPDPTVGFRPYGGWSAPVIKQYLGTSTVAGIGNVDQNVLTDDEADTLHPIELTPDQKRIADLTTALSSVTAQGGEIRVALTNASKLTTVKAMRQALMAIDNRLAAINQQFL